MKNWLYIEQDDINKNAQNEFEKINSFYFMDDIIRDLLWDDDMDKSFAECYETFEPSIFLHGDCLLFAFALREIFGYDVHVIYPKDFFDRIDAYIIHAYCTYKDPLTGETLYIDIRGITNDKELFLKEFKNDIDENNGKIKEKVFMDKEKCYDFFGFSKKDIDEDCDDLEELTSEEDTFEFAKHIVQNHWMKTYYDAIQLDRSLCA